jgi:heat-inducible transcriptional repressor
VPTDAGHRYVVDRLLRAGQDSLPTRPLELSLIRREVDEAMRATTETLSQVTNLLAIVTAPPIETSTIRHIEVLLLQPQVLMVVVITSTGGVTKRLFTFAEPIDPGLADWAASYLNERLVGLGLGARILQKRLHDPSLSSSESDFLDALSPVFTELEDDAHETLYVEGTSRLFSQDRLGEVSELNALMDMLERRVTLLGVLHVALNQRDVLVRIGAENDVPALRSLALVAAAYGLPQRRLGTVSVIGPLRMDYGHAIKVVRDAASQLSSFVADIYDER